MRLKDKMQLISSDNDKLKCNSKDQPADQEIKMQKFAVCAFLMKTFCFCLLMAVLTFTLGVAVVTLAPKLKPIKEGLQLKRATEKSQNFSHSVDPKYKYLNKMQKSKRFILQGGVVQWARYRANPADYDTPEERAFGESIHSSNARMTASTLLIKPNGCRVPHWHFNANEHGYLASGTAWIGILDSAPFSVTSYNVTKGQVIFLPRSTLHWMKCIGREDCLFILFFTTSNELVTRDVDDVFYATPKDIAARSLKPKGGISFINSFKQPKENQAINLPPNLNELVHKASYTKSSFFRVSRYFFDMRASRKFRYPGGIMQWARYTKRKFWLPKSERIFAKSLNEHADTVTLATMQIFRNGMRQPHYHFNADTMGYVLAGCGRLQTLDMDVYFQSTADFILAQLFLKKQEEFRKIPKFKTDQDINLP
ncbi:hypothetical protein JZ751_018932 [Albula glossodonta]|uniref:Cupin type-1 domain-containing protein n=1 Tax=Albula glossodonta TaxID=121402 RepID=A0A8T2MT25_9TELE|nr:hypothetical protein JZ751_018932 [Albula glossodonta]